MLSSASSASEHREGRVCSHRRTLAFHNATPRAQRLPERVLDVTKKYPEGLVKTVAISPQGASASKVVGQPDLAVIDKDGYAFTEYQVSPEKPMIVIVRPDGVVGGIVYGLDGFEKYFGNIFSSVQAS